MKQTNTTTWIAALLLVILLGAFAGILVMYYLQPFAEIYHWQTTVNYADIVVQSNTYEPDTTSLAYITHAEATLGSLELKNTGTFDKLYKPATLVGCIELRSEQTSPELAKQLQFTVQASSQKDIGMIYDYQYQPLTIKKGETRTLDLRAQFNGNVPKKDFVKTNLRGLTIYKVPTREDNPIYISNGQYYDQRAGYQSCSQLADSAEKVAFLTFN